MIFYSRVRTLREFVVLRTPTPKAKDLLFIFWRDQAIISRVIRRFGRRSIPSARRPGVGPNPFLALNARVDACSRLSLTIAVWPLRLSEFYPYNTSNVAP